MKIQSLGHVVLRVRDLERSKKFYSDVLGLPLVADYEERAMAFYSLGDHHDFAIAALGADAPVADKKAAGLAHVAFKVGEDFENLKEAKAHLEANGITVRAVDHEVTQSLYFDDPDGNTLEVYIDSSDAWKQEPQRVAQGGPLAI